VSWLWCCQNEAVLEPKPSRPAPRLLRPRVGPAAAASCCALTLEAWTCG